MDKISQLKSLESEIAANRDLPLMESNLVFGEGNVDCAVMFIGEAPGKNENEQRRPFVGRGGQLLNQMIESIGWKRADVYITNIVKRRPPDNRDPLPEEIEAYKPYLTRQIEIVNPKVIATLGRFSMNYFLPNAKITRDHGRVILARRIHLGNGPAAVREEFSSERRDLPRGDMSISLGGNPASQPKMTPKAADSTLQSVSEMDSWMIFPILHPAAALRAPEMMRMFRQDFPALAKVVANGGTVEIVLPPAMAEKPKPKK